MASVAARTAEPFAAPRALTVTELARLLRETLRGNPLLTRVLVRGEIGDVSRSPAGHRFFTLRDEGAQVACALFREAAADLGFEPEEGMDVVASGDIDLFARRGEVQLVVRFLTPAGVGAFWAAFQQTRRRLEVDGLLDPARKRPLPLYPRRIGVVTSEQGAVLHDIVTVLRRRWPLAAVILSPALVQGPEAPESLREALLRIQDRVDLVLLARGGGSLEDLWAFNEEALARAVAACPVPVVSAVGHETDVTIIDFVADVRAPTPSAAAEIVSPDAVELLAHIRDLGESLLEQMGSALRERRTALGTLVDRLSPRALRREIGEDRTRLTRASRTLVERIRGILVRREDGLVALQARLEAVGPMATLRRGYAIIEREGGRVLTRTADVAPGDVLTVRLQDGKLRVHVASIEEVP